MLTLLLLASAHAATPVLVSAFQARNSEATGLSGLLEDALARELARDEGLALIRVDDTPDFKDYSARVYMDGCPPGDVIGCTQIVAQRGRAAYAVTGTVQTLPGGSRVEIDILDIAGARIAVSFTSDLKEGEDGVFAAGVAKVLDAVVRGQMGQETDIRDRGDEPAAPIDKDAVAAELEELSQQLAEAKMRAQAEDRPIPETTYTIEDLTERMGTEGSKPWDRLQMTPAEYLRYKNSGMPLFEWRDRTTGRQGSVLLRPGVSYWNGPTEATWYGRVGLQETNFQPVDSYAYQSIANSSSGGIVAEVAFGVLPYLDIGIEGGLHNGGYTVDYAETTVGQPPEFSSPKRLPAATLSVGGRARVALFPVQKLHPTVALGVDYVPGHAVGDFYSLPPSAHTELAPTNLLYARIVPGGEAELGKYVDVWATIPIDLLLSGGEYQVVRTGTEEAVETGAPSNAPPVSFGLEAGLQVRFRLFQPKLPTGVDDMEDP